MVLLSRNARRLEAVYDEIVAAGSPEPAAIPMDLTETSDEQFEQLALQIYKELGRLDGIVHCAAAPGMPYRRCGTSVSKNG